MTKSMLVLINDQAVNIFDISVISQIQRWTHASYNGHYYFVCTLSTGKDIQMSVDILDKSPESDEVARKLVTEKRQRLIMMINKGKIVEL